MCMCGKPVKNGEPGYSWDGKTFGTHGVNAPEIGEGDIILYDETGRCGGLDSHSYHYRVVQRRHCGIDLLVRHGGGDERISFMGTSQTLLAPLKSLDSTARYWLLNALYHAHSDAKREARNKEANLWRQAAAEKRIKTRKIRGQSAVKVWIEERKVEEEDR